MKQNQFTTFWFLIGIQTHTEIQELVCNKCKMFSKCTRYPYSMKCTRYPLPYSVKCTRYLPPILYERHQVTSSPIEINQVLLSPLAWTKPGTPVLIVWNALDTPCIVWNAPCTPLTNNMKCTRYPYAAWNAPGIPMQHEMHQVSLPL